MTEQVDPSIVDALERVGLRYVESQEGFVLVPVHWQCEAGERTQLVYVLSASLEFGGRKWSRLFAIVKKGELPESGVLAYCLRRNAATLAGKWSLHADEDRERSVLLFETSIEAGAEPDELKERVFAVASEADEVEREIAGQN